MRAVADLAPNSTWSGLTADMPRLLHLNNFHDATLDHIKIDKSASIMCVFHPYIAKTIELSKIINSDENIRQSNLLLQINSNIQKISLITSLI
jgi:hypothetical protein